eukprot:c23873_g1_i2 orf=592-2913(-)
METLRGNSFPALRLKQSLAQREHKKNSSLDQAQAGMPPRHSCSLSPNSSLVDISPPSTPSPRRSFVHPGSSSTASPSIAPHPLHTLSPPSLMYPSQSKPQPFCEGDDSKKASAKSDISSPCPSHVASTPKPTLPEVAIARPSVESLSLEQHLHDHCDAGQKEAAMQSFILERFLPAAKAVAADHDCAFYTTKSSATMPSSTPYSPKRNSTKNTLPLLSVIKSRSPSTLNASKSVTWSPLPVCQDVCETESFEHEAEAPTKSCGSFCVGLKTALSRVHKVVHTSAYSNKSRAKLSSHGTSSDEEEEGVVSKVKVLAQSTQKQRSAHTLASMSFPSSSVTSVTLDDWSSRFMATSRSSMATSRSGFRKGDGNIIDNSPADSLTSSNSAPLRNQSVKSHSSSPNTPTQRPPPTDNTDQNNSMRPPMNAKQTPGEISLEGRLLHNASRQTASGSSSQDPASRADSKACCNVVEGTSGGASLEGRSQRNAFRRTTSGSSLQGPAGRAGSEGSLVHCNAGEGALKDRDCTEDDDEHEFHDALNRFDTPGDATPLADKSPNTQKASGLEQEEEEGEESSAHHASAGSVLHATAAKQKPGQARVDSGKESCSQKMNGVYSVHPSSAPPILKLQCTTSNGNKQWASPSVLGWPLGFTRFQSDIKTTFSQEHAKHDDRFVASPRFASNVSSPPVPPSPAAGSWLGKAMALKASKPSTLATLQQKETSASVKKNLEFILLDAKKEVRWEDVVKGSQMHSEQFRLSEEIRHSHPSNRSAMKPLRL